MSSTAVTLERLQLEHALHAGVCRYARMCDERDWAAFDSVFARDATADYGGHALADTAAILAMLRRNLGGCGPTQHLLGNLLVEIGPDQQVRSRTAVRASHRGAGDRAELSYDCIGEYHDRWTLTAAGWRIAHRSMRVTLEQGTRRVLRAEAS
jgi:3-phenylpropionate/cinnamic acid dioxygenase small subunit